MSIFHHENVFDQFSENIPEGAGCAESNGWYLVGKVASGGLGGWAIAVGPRRTTWMHDAAVIPAIHEIARSVGAETL